MVYQQNYGNSPYSEEIPYDLRQIYAVQIVGEHLQDVARARKADDYINYLKSLKDLWIITQHKIKAKDKEAPEEYRKLLNNANKVINENSKVFIGKHKDSKGIFLIEKALNEIEMFLYDKIEDAKMFGAKREVEHLM